MPMPNGHGGYPWMGGPILLLVVFLVVLFLPIDPESSLGGAREIGANSYYYAFGHRGLLVDAGFDATRDGWLGLPAFERIPRLDPVSGQGSRARPTHLRVDVAVEAWATRIERSTLVWWLRSKMTAVSRAAYPLVRPGFHAFRPSRSRSGRTAGSS